MIEETSGWSGDGEFTTRVIAALRGMAEIEYVRVEDAPASRVEAGYNFLCNEIFVRFAPAWQKETSWWRRALAAGRRGQAPGMSLADLESRLAAIEAVGPADHADETMLQYLKAERIVPPYQTHGYKVVELVRVYEATRTA